MIEKFILVFDFYKLVLVGRTFKNINYFGDDGNMIH